MMFLNVHKNKQQSKMVKVNEMLLAEGDSNTLPWL